MIGNSLPRQAEEEPIDPTAGGRLSGLRPYLRGFVLIASLIAIGFMVQATGLFGLFDEAWIDSRIRNRPMGGVMLFLGIGCVLTAIGFPRQVVAFLGGYAFGFGLGTALSLVAAVLGCLATLTYARLLGRELLLARFPERLARIDRFLRADPFFKAVMIRLLPVGSNVLVNLAAGISGIRVFPFVAGSALGYVPQMAIFALLGSGIHINPEIRIAASVVLFVLSGMLGAYLYSRFRATRREQAREREQTGS